MKHLELSTDPVLTIITILNLKSLTSHLLKLRLTKPPSLPSLLLRTVHSTIVNISLSNEILISFLAIIGSTVVQQNSALELDIICKFGRFGTTAGALIAYNQIRCPTPSTRIDSSSFAQEAVQVQIALNGQDYLTVPTAFTFTGTGTGTGNGDGNQPVITDTYVTTSESSAADWFMPLVTAFVFVSFIFYITNRRFPNFNKEEIPLVGGIQRSDAIIGQEPTMSKGLNLNFC